MASKRHFASFGSRKKANYFGRNGESVGKRVVDKGESSTSIRLSNLVLENNC